MFQVRIDIVYFCSRPLTKSFKQKYVLRTKITIPFSFDNSTGIQYTACPGNLKSSFGSREEWIATVTFVKQKNNTVL